MTTHSAYLIHFDPPYRHAGHYVGITLGGAEAVARRFEEHESGEGANLTRVARRAGSTLVLARTWIGVQRKFEMKLKGRGLRPLCPICRLRGDADRVISAPRT